jgi:hypothetical protein
LSVQRLARGCDGKASCKSSSTELGSSTSWCKYSANGNVFDELGVDLGALDKGLECAGEEIGRLGVFETTLTALSEGSAESACYNDLVSCQYSALHSPMARGDPDIPPTALFATSLK